MHHAEGDVKGTSYISKTNSIFLVLKQGKLSSILIVCIAILIDKSQKMTNMFLPVCSTYLDLHLWWTVCQKYSTSRY